MTETSLFKNRFRFTESIDLQLLQEVCGQNPFENPTRWNTIVVNMLQITGKSITVRTLKERVQNLVKKYLTKIRLYEGKSGVEVEVSEQDDLLHQIADLMQEFQGKKNTKSIETEKSSYQKGYDQRELACSSMMASPMEGKNEDEHVWQSCGFAEVDVELQIVNENNGQGASADCQISKENTPSLKRKSAQSNIATPICKRAPVGVKQTTLQYLAKKKMKMHLKLKVGNWQFKKEGWY
ncbi:uncharacterized protein [Diabrotica undecimpunctata]|uniref:uncharacterized protein n=1 Tax=Diabrotica undecimpunctata TaxID=50387 RepID=UPI003B638D43